MIVLDYHTNNQFEPFISFHENTILSEQIDKTNKLLFEEQKKTIESTMKECFIIIGSPNNQNHHQKCAIARFNEN